MAVPGTSAGLGLGAYRGVGTGAPGSTLPEGGLTSAVYGALRELAYADALTHLHAALDAFPRSRAALSLLGYCYYQMQDFRAAAQCYEELVKYYPEIDSYRLYLATCLYKVGLYPEAKRVCVRVRESEDLASRATMLLAAIAYEEDDLVSSKALLEECVSDDPDTLVGRACIAYKERQLPQALSLLSSAAGGATGSGTPPDILYTVALCHFAGRSFGPALKCLSEIIETGIRLHPQLSVGAHTDGVAVRSVGNTHTLKSTSLVEAFNLKAAIEFALGNMEAAREALTDMPPRTEAELDPVTLHNTALMYMDKDATGGFRKLNFLLTNPPFPPCTFSNVLILLLRHGFAHMAADVMAENVHLTLKYLTPELYEFLDATIMVPTSPEEAFRKFDALTTKHIDALRRHTKAIQDARLARESAGIKSALAAYDAALEAYIPVLMGMAKIYWDRGDYAQVETIFRQASEFASEHETWKLNVAHTFFMQEGKYREAIRYYQPLVQKHWDSLLDVTAIVLANVCVAYIMTSQNEEAERIMARVEEEEKARPTSAPPVFHLCIINLVIGTLYCSKNNYEFGISRIMKSLEPMDRKLGSDTWFYAKRCMLALGEGLAKHMITLRDGVWEEVFTFLDAADAAGKGIATLIAGTKEEVLAADGPKHSVSHEARMLKRLFMQLRDAQ